MSDIMNVLKQEISRLARKEIKKAMIPLKKIMSSQRKLITELRKQITAVGKEKATGRKTALKSADAVAVEEGRFWITGKGVHKMRAKMGLTQSVFAKLLGVSVPTIVKWEKVSGKVPVRRKETIAKLQQFRGMGKREAAALTGGAVKAKKKAAKKAAKAGKAKQEKKGQRGRKKGVAKKVASPKAAAKKNASAKAHAQEAVAPKAVAKEDVAPQAVVVEPAVPVTPPQA